MKIIANRSEPEYPSKQTQLKKEYKQSKRDEGSTIGWWLLFILFIACLVGYVVFYF